MVARTVEEIPTSGGVQIEEDTGHNNDLLLQTGLEEVQTVGDLAGETFQVEPDVEGAVRHVLDHEAHVTEALDHIVALVAEVSLQRNHLLLHKGRLKHGNRGLLERCVGTTIEVGTAGADTMFIVSIGLLRSQDLPAGFVSTYALINSLGPRIHAIRQPGKRKRLVRPSMIRTSSSSTSSTFSAAEMVVPSQLLV